MASGSWIKSELEEIKKRWRRRHFGESGIIAHHHLAWPALVRREGVEPCMVLRRPHGRERRFDDDFLKRRLRSGHSRCVPGARNGFMSVVHPAHLPWSPAAHISALGKSRKGRSVREPNIPRPAAFSPQVSFGTDRLVGTTIRHSRRWHPSHPNALPESAGMGPSRRNRTHNNRLAPAAASCRTRYRYRKSGTHWSAWSPISR